MSLDRQGDYPRLLLSTMDITWGGKSGEHTENMTTHG